MPIRRIAISILLLLAQPLAVLADAGVDLASPPAQLNGGDIANLGVSLGIVVAAIVGLGWLYSRSKLGVGAGNGVINIVATRPLGPKERVLLLEIADKQLLVGMTATNVQTLHVFDEPIIAAEAVETATGGFAGRLRSALKDVGK